MKLGIYVGSFNPVHKGHKYVMDYLINNNYIDELVVIPTGNYWDKNNLVDIKHRINMLKFYETNKIIVNDNLNNLEYTYQILREFNDDLYLIIGADNLPKLHLWKNIDEILKYKIIVLKRDDIDIEEYINKFDYKGNFIVVDDFKKMDISSTNIRKLIEQDKNMKLKEFLDTEIIDYIHDNNLYE